MIITAFLKGGPADSETLDINSEDPWVLYLPVHEGILVPTDKLETVNYRIGSYQVVFENGKPKPVGYFFEWKGLV